MTAGRLVLFALCLFAAFILGVRLERYDAGHAQPWRWRGGAGPETECWFEYEANGSGTKHGRVFVEQWTACEHEAAS